jgi:hypothetical protein
MSASFIAMALLAVVLILNWRLVLLVLTACLVALILMGLGVADGQATAGHEPPVPTTAPAEPAQGPADGSRAGVG